MSKEKPGIVLEIGVGAYPLRPNPTMLSSYDGRETMRKFNNGSMYIGIDMPDDPNRYWYNYIFGEEPRTPLSSEERNILMRQFAGAQKELNAIRPGENMQLMVADGHKTPFKDASIDEVYLSNVIGSQLQSESQTSLLAEVKRILKNTGKIVIRETYTPYNADPDFNLPELLDQFGFEIDELAKFGDQRYGELQDVYGVGEEELDRQHLRSDMYYCIAKPAQLS